MHVCVCARVPFDGNMQRRDTKIVANVDELLEGEADAALALG